MVVAIPQRLKPYPLLAYIWQLVHRYNGNFILLVVGLPGKGKSYAALNFLSSLMIDAKGRQVINRHNAMDFLAFSFQEFAKKVEENNRKGDVIVWEEAATMEGANARTFYEQANVYMSSLFQTMRYKNQIAILTLPSGHYLDKQLRQICHATLVMSGHNDKFSWGKFYLHSFNPKQNMVYDRLPRFVDSNGHLVKVRGVRFHLPAKWLVDVYETKQKAWKSELQKQVNVFIEKERLKESVKDKNSLRVVYDICRKRWRDFYDFDKKKFVPELIYSDDEVSDAVELSLTYARSIAKTLQIKKDKGSL